MRIVLRCMLLLAWAAGYAQTNARQSEEESRILTLENAWNQAVQTKDAKAIDPLMDGELIEIDYDGSVMNKAQYLASIGAPATHIDHVANESVQVHVFGQSAVVIGVYNEKGSMHGKRYSRRERFVDTWFQRNGIWVCVASQSTLIAH